MNLYERVSDSLLTMPVVREWPELRTLIRRTASRCPEQWQLPLLACVSVGGSPQQAVPVVAAVACLFMSILLIDDMLDADPRGEHRHLGMAAAANLAAVLQAVGLEVIANSSYSPAVKLAILQTLNQKALHTAYGQHLDVRGANCEAAYWRLVQMKSGHYFGTLMQVGALAGEAGAETAVSLRHLGCIYGEMIQVHDDLSDTLSREAYADWTAGRSPLPILFAATVQHPERRRFCRLRQTLAGCAVIEPEALAEAQAILIRCGAVSYCLYQLLHRFDKAQCTLADCSVPYKTDLQSLFNNLTEPVQSLFNTVTPPALI